MPRYGAGGPFETDPLRPEIQGQVLRGATAGRVIFLGAQGVRGTRGGQREPAGDGAPAAAFDFGCRGALVGGDEARIQVDNGPRGVRADEVKLPRLRVLVIGGPAGEVNSPQDDVARRPIGPEQFDGPATANDFGDL